MLKTAGIDSIQTKQAGRVNTTKSKRNIYIYIYVELLLCLSTPEKPQNDSKFLLHLLPGNYLIQCQVVRG